MSLIKQIPESELRKPSSQCIGNDASGKFNTTLWNPSEARDLIRRGLRRGQSQTTDIRRSQNPEREKFQS